MKHCKVKNYKILFQCLTVVVCFAAVLSLCHPMPALADMGPKASVRIMFENMGDELCDGTLLSKTKSNIVNG